MKYLYYIVLCLFILAPINVFAETINNHQNSQEILDLDNISIDKQSNSKLNTYNNKSNHKKRYYTTKHKTHSNDYMVRYYVDKRPVYKSSVIVVDKEPQYTEYNNSVNKVNTNKNFGIGLYGVIASNSAFGNLKSHTSGGFGYYIKYRPVRFLSIEFTNSFLFGILNYIYNNIDLNQEYTKIPLSLGFRLHFMDYSDLDVYISIAASMSSIKYRNSLSKDFYYNKFGYQHGGKFGIGFCYIIDYIELGFDVRYTLESVPDFIPYYVSNESDKYIHGSLFTLSIGFIL